MNSKIVVYLTCLVMVASAGVCIAYEHCSCPEPREATSDDNHNLMLISDGIYSEHLSSATEFIPEINDGSPFQPSPYKPYDSDGPQF